MVTTTRRGKDKIPDSTGIRDWSAFALLLIDVQKDFWTEEIATAFPDYDKKVTALLALCRAEGIDVVHLHAEFSGDKSDWMARYKLRGDIPCVADTSGVELLPYARETDVEPVIKKQTFDGFCNAELNDYLVANNKKYLLVAGLVTSVCVLLTAASAAQRGYLVAVVEDCCADAVAAHRHALAQYPFIFEKTKVADLKSEWERWCADLDRLTVR